ncbi:MAG: glycerol-3-phosphate 1-O-acyltransferase PlsY [Planctomycetota bacterium]
MLSMLIWSLWMVFAYLLGSVSFALMLGRIKGLDIRTFGSGNVGATNLGRALGGGWFIACTLLDMGKGLIPVVGYRVSLFAMGVPVDTSLDMLLWLAIGMTAVVGHVLPVFLKFKGGKGVATSAGALFGFWPVLTVPAVGAFVIWFIVTKATAYIGLASVAAAAALPIFTLIFGLSMGYAPGIVGVTSGVSTLLALMVIVRHRSNITRLRAGTEAKVQWGEAKHAPDARHE